LSSASWTLELCVAATVSSDDVLVVFQHTFWQCCYVKAQFVLSFTSDWLLTVYLTIKATVEGLSFDVHARNVSTVSQYSMLVLHQRVWVINTPLISHGHCVIQCNNSVNDVWLMTVNKRQAPMNAHSLHLSSRLRHLAKRQIVVKPLTLPYGSSIYRSCTFRYWCSCSTTSTVLQSSSSRRPTTPTEHIRPSGLLCRWSVCLELSTGRAPGSRH